MKYSSEVQRSFDELVLWVWFLYSFQCMCKVHRCQSTIQYDQINLANKIHIQD